MLRTSKQCSLQFLNFRQHRCFFNEKNSIRTFFILFFIFSSFGIFARPDTYDTSLSLKDKNESGLLTAFTFDCAKATVNNAFYASGVVQTGTITIPITGVSAGTSRIVVTNTNGFSGGLTNTTISATQTSIQVPITFTGLSTVGTYTVVISSPDATNSCNVSVTVANCSAYAPTISTNRPLLLCIGDSVTMTASLGTRYQWSTGETTASITKKAAGDYTVTVTAAGCTGSTSNTITTNNNCEVGFCGGILNPNGLIITFGKGNRTDLPNAVSGATSTHVYSPTGVIVDGQYSVANNANAAGAWAINVPDHSGDGTSGRLMVVNADNTPKECFRIPISGLCSNLKYEFSAWIQSISNRPEKPNITFEIREAGTDNLLAVKGTGNVPYGDWVKYGLTFNTTSTTDLVLVLRNNNRGGLNGNDFVVDDIQFAYCGPPTVLTIEGGSSFNATTGEAIACPATPLTIKSTITPGFIRVPEYQWQESTDNGLTWRDIAGATNATYSLPATTTLAGRKFRLLLAEVGKIGNPRCRVNSNAVFYTLAGGTGNITTSGATTFCQGDSVILTAMTGVGYNWSNGAKTQSITVTTAGTYNVTVTDAGGCSSSASQTINVNSRPIVAISVVGEGNLSSGGTATLTASGGDAYEWNIGLKTASIIINTGGTYTVTVTNATTGCSATASRSVNATNAAPNATTIIVNLKSNSTFVGTVTANVSDPNNNIDPNGYAITDVPKNGVINMTPDGFYTYTPNAGFVGVDSVHFKVCDLGNLCTVNTIIFNVTFSNNPPVFADATPSVSEDTPLIGNLAPNASDADGNLDPSSFTLITPPKNGTFNLNPTGSYTYTPNPNFNGKDSVKVRVCDASGACDTATITILIAPVNDAPILANATPSVQEDIPITSSVAPNASDPDGNLDDKSFTLTDSPLHGTINMKPDGTYTYTPKPNFNGQDSVHYKVCDLTGLCATATLIFTVTPVNDAPILTDATPSVQEDTPIIGALSPNATDVDGNLNPNSFTLIDNPKNGVFVLNPDGAYTYTPKPDFSGVDSVKVRVCDFTSLCDTATIVFTVNAVNDAPILKNGTASLDEDSPISGTVKPNASDVDGNLNPTSFVLVDSPLNGTTIMNPDGNYTYTPKPNFSGTDSVHYRVCDMNGACTQATLIFTVNPVNDPPTLLNATPSTDEDVILTGTVKPLGSDIDGNLNNSSFAVLDLPQHGSIIMNPNGTYTYTPALNFNGIDSVHYRVCDLGGLCTTATIIIEVSSRNDAPVLTNAIASGKEDTPISGTVVPNATDIDGNLNPNGFSVISEPKNGTITMNPNGTFNYIPNSNFTGEDSVQYRVCDLAGSCTSATLKFNVMPANDPPNLSNTTPSVQEDASVSGNLAPNASDVDGDLNPNSFTPISIPKNGTLILNPDGTFTYTPKPNFNGLDTAQYRVCDLSGACDTSFIIFTVNPVNDAPVLINTIVSVLEDSTITGTTIQNASDPDNNLDIQSFKLIDSPAQGIITMNPDGSFTYTPFKNFNGTDSVHYRVCDKLGACSVGTLTFNILPVNDQPKATITAPIVTEDATVSFCGIITDIDAGEVFNAQSCNTPKGTLSYTISGNQLCLTYIPAKNFNGVDSICLLVCDKGGLCDTIRLPITVTPLNDVPVLIVSPMEVPSDSTVIQCFPINDPDLGDIFSASVCGTKNGSARTRIDNSNLCVTYNATNLSATSDTICIIVCDKSGACSQANIPVVIKPCNDNFEPIINCPENVEVSYIGTIISDPSNFLTTVSVADNCQGIKLTFKTPIATDDCMANPVVQQISGSISGSIFPKGTSALFFESVDKTGKKGNCTVQITVSHTELISMETAKVCLTDVLTVSALPLSNATYLWRGPRNYTSTNQNLLLPITNVNMAGQYSVTATYGRNCNLTDSLTVTVNDIPVLKNDTFLLAVEGISKGNILANDILTGASYKLNIINNISTGSLQLINDGTMTYKAPVGFKGTEKFSYEICVRECPNNCPKADVFLKISDNFKPPVLTADEVITPNDDGYNDALVINNFNPNDPDNKSSIIIYNQWGGVVYQATPYMNDWDGTYNDVPLPAGTYYYIFRKDNAGEPLKSFITILR